MRKCTQYSAEFKEKLLAKAFSPNAPSHVELARRSGVPYHTLYQWISMSKKKKKVKSDDAAMRPKDKTAEAKLRAVFDTLQMTEEERGAYCRKHGLYTYHLDEWKTQILAGLKPIEPREHKAEYRQLTVENKTLKKELNRKEKALAEASALLILKKKADLIWGDGEGD
jgi:transposase-like protein